jgi:hypothetical protein
MAEPKTKATTASVKDFLDSIEPEDKRKDGFALLEIFEKATGEKAVMWGPSIVGFGSYHYKSERSSQEGDWLATGFSPRKQNLTLYVMAGNQDSPALKKLGKFKTSVGCLYINKLADVDVKLLPDLIKNCYHYMKQQDK